MTKRATATTPKDGEDYVAQRRQSRLLLVPNHPERPKIISDRELPQQTRGGCKKFDHFYPFEDMKPGDSFWVPSTTQCTAGAVTKFSKKSGWKFVSRGQTEDGRSNKGVSGKPRSGNRKRGTRVWRVS